MEVRQAAAVNFKNTVKYHWVRGFHGSVWVGERSGAGSDASWVSGLETGLLLMPAAAAGVPAAGGAR